jgi:uncharacterized membrane protein
VLYVILCSPLLVSVTVNKDLARHTNLLFEITTSYLLVLVRAGRMQRTDVSMRYRFSFRYITSLSVEQLY